MYEGIDEVFASTKEETCMVDEHKNIFPELPQKKEVQFSLLQKHLDGVSKSLSENIYQQLNQVEVKLLILSAQQQTIISRISRINDTLKGESWTKVQETLPHYIHILGQMKNRMEKALLLVRTFPARQTGLINTNNRIISLKKWKEGEINARLEAEESKIQVHQVKLKAHRPISFDLPKTDEPQVVDSTTPLSTSIASTSYFKAERIASSSPKMSISRKPHDKKKIAPLFASLLSSLPPPSPDSNQSEE